jgi:hypothetical protein
VSNGRTWINSFLRVAQNDSAAALSKQMPVRPTEFLIPRLAQKPTNAALVYFGMDWHSLTLGAIRVVQHQSRGIPFRHVELTQTRGRNIGRTHVAATKADVGHHGVVFWHE